MYIIMGASSGVGRALAEEFAAKGSNLVLVSRDDRDTAPIASDLSLRFGVCIQSIKLDLEHVKPDYSKILELVDEAGEYFRGMLFPAGIVNNSDTLTAIDSSSINELFRVNCLSICQLINDILKRSHKDCKLSIIGFGSIASIRARRSNMIYSAAKTALRFYFESLRHACVNKNIAVQFYVLGYMDTNLAFAYTLLLPKAAPDKLAQRVYRDLDKDIGVKFFPRFWLIISWIIKLIPWKFYKQLNY